jgi:3-oxoacyl-[acyl-carrier protein] reductase
MAASDTGALPVALVTGATGGIGTACCAALAAEGFSIAVHYNRNERGAAELAAELPDSFAVRADLSDPEQIESLVRELKERTARIDVLVNNAGVTRDAPMMAAKLRDFDAVSSIGRGTWYLTKMIVRRFMLRAGCGRIINVSSVVGHTGNAGQIPYAMEKAGVDALTKSLAQELRGCGILVNSIAPGFIDTEMTRTLPEGICSEILQRIPLQRMGNAEEVADVVAFLATRGEYINGTVVHVNGGLYGG